MRGPIKRAVVSVTGLGLYELRINGQRVGDHLLAPEWTRYSKRIQYQTYDVTESAPRRPQRRRRPAERRLVDGAADGQAADGEVRSSAC